MHMSVYTCIRKHLSANPNSEFFNRLYPIENNGCFRKCRILQDKVKLNGIECLVWSDASGSETVHHYFNAKTFAYMWIATSHTKK